MVAQVVDDTVGRTLVSASTMESDARQASADKTAKARKVGQVIADRAKQAGIEAGDVILGLASSGPHSNGYSLVRKLVEMSGVGYSAKAPFDRTRRLADALLAPTRIYVKPILKAMKQTDAIKALAHITGGGFIENIPRVLPKGMGVRLDLARVPVLPVFKWLARTGNIAEKEMLRTFNCGVGMILIVEPRAANAIARILRREGETVMILGEVIRIPHDKPQVSYAGNLDL